MGLLNALARRLVEAGSRERVTVAGLEYEPSSIASRHDVPVELGLTEREFVEAILVDNRGRVRQRALTYYTDWSASQTSRVLAELEADGAIVRTRAGREKIVHLPGEDDPAGLAAPRPE